MMEYDISTVQLEMMREAASNPWGRVSIFRQTDSQPLVAQGWMIPIGDTGMTFEITDKGLARLGLDVQQVRAAQQENQPRPKRKVGRPRTRPAGAKRPKREFYMLEKKPLTETLMEQAHRDYKDRHDGQDCTDADMLRLALIHYIG